MPQPMCPLRTRVSLGQGLASQPLRSTVLLLSSERRFGRQSLGSRLCEPSAIGTPSEKGAIIPLFVGEDVLHQLESLFGVERRH